MFKVSRNSLFYRAITKIDPYHFTEWDSDNGKYAEHIDSCNVFSALFKLLFIGILALVAIFMVSMYLIGAVAYFSIALGLLAWGASWVTGPITVFFTASFVTILIATVCGFMSFVSYLDRSDTSFVNTVKVAVRSRMERMCVKGELID